MRAFFYDTWGFLALANARDTDHDLAAEGDRWRERNGYLVVTSDYVLDETLTGLHLAAGPRVAIRFLDLFLTRVAAETLQLLEINSIRREHSIDLFRKRIPASPRLSFTDCTSFALMKELGIDLAFTSDRHFHQADTRIRPLFERRGGRTYWRPPK